MTEGLTDSETSVTAVTVKVADPVMEDELAVIVVEPAATPVANPVLPIPAIVGAEEVQVAEAVRSCVVPSLYMPVALNCWVRATTTEADAGVTVMETRVAPATVSVVVPLIDPDMAVRVTPPSATPVASPSVPASLLIAATAGLEELQVTDVVRSCVLWSE